jgi:hypothetical protein
MRKNTDSHLKTRTVAVKNVSRSFLRYCAGAKKKVFCEDTGIHVFGEVFWGFLIGVIAWVVH